MENSNILENTSTSSDVSLTGTNYMVTNGIQYGQATQGITYYNTYPQYVNYDIQLRKLENGWVLLKGGKEYILKSPDEVVKYMKENK